MEKAKIPPPTRMAKIQFPQSGRFGIEDIYRDKAR